MRALLLALCVVLAGPVHALSCLPPDVVRTYLEADASEDRWGAAVGRLYFDESRLPPTIDNTTQMDVDLRAQLIGHSLQPDGFTAPFQGNVTLSIVCYGSWCGSARSGDYYLAFVLREEKRHVVIADPCRTWLFSSPDRDDLEKLQQCFTGGYCQPEADR